MQIWTPNTFQYVQIYQLVCAHIWWYMHVYYSISMYLLTAGCRCNGRTMCMQLNGQYLYVYERICIYLDSIRQYDSEFSSISQWNCTEVDSMSIRAHKDTFCWQQKWFIAHFSLAILLVVNWPNHAPGVDVELACPLQACFPAAEAPAESVQCWAVQTIGSRKLVVFPTLTTNGEVLLRVTRRAFPILISSSTSQSSGFRWRKWQYLHC